MRANFKLQRLFVHDGLVENAAIALDRDQINYLMNVLRLGDGAELLLFNGRDGEWLGRLVAHSRKKAELTAIEQTRSQPAASDLVYLFAPLKQARLDYMVQKAVEMGVGVLQPVLTHHTQMHRIKVDRVAANIREAAEQCGILGLPEAREPVKLETLLAGWDEARHIVFCDEGAAGDNPLGLLKQMEKRRLALLVGPEGGFSESERQMLSALPFVTAIPLGPRILRADTAAVAALAVIQAAIGDWRG